MLQRLNVKNVIDVASSAQGARSGASSRPQRIRSALVFIPLLVGAIGSAQPADARVGCLDVGDPATTVLHLPNVTKTLGGPQGWDTPFIVQNVGAARTTLQVIFLPFDEQRSPLRCKDNITLAPGASWAEIPNNDPDLADDTQYAVVVRSYGSPVVGLVNEIRGAGDQQEAMAYSGITTGVTKAYLPNVADLYFGFETYIIIQNLNANAVAHFTASFVSFDGTKTRSFDSGGVGGYRSYVIDPQAIAGFVPGTQYAATITSDQPMAVVQNTARISGGPHVSSSHTGLTDGASRLSAAYLTVNMPAPDGVSPVVIENVGPAVTAPKVTVTLNVTGATLPNCSVGICTYTFQGPLVDPGHSWVFDPRDHLCTTSTPTVLCLPAGTSGGVSIETTLMTGTGANLGATTFDPAGRIATVVLPTSETTTMAYQAQTPSNTVYLPNVTRRLGGADGWTTPIRIFGSGAVTLSWYRFSDGALVVDQPVSVGVYCCGEAGSVRARSVTVDPRDVLQLSDDAQYSVVIRSAGTAPVPFVAAVTEYAAGGDNAMAYEGFPR
jgi:hypothetical protein